MFSRTLIFKQYWVHWTPLIRGFEGIGYNKNTYYSNSVTLNNFNLWVSYTKPQPTQGSGVLYRIFSASQDRMSLPTRQGCASRLAANLGTGAVVSYSIPSQPGQVFFTDLAWVCQTYHSSQYGQWFPTTFPYSQKVNNRFQIYMKYVYKGFCTSLT